MGIPDQEKTGLLDKILLSLLSNDLTNNLVIHVSHSSDTLNDLQTALAKKLEAPYLNYSEIYHNLVIHYGFATLFLKITYGL